MERYAIMPVCIYAQCIQLADHIDFNHQALPEEFPSQEHGSRLPFSPPGNLPVPGIQPTSPESLALAVVLFTTALLWKSCMSLYICPHPQNREQQEGNLRQTMAIEYL